MTVDVVHFHRDDDLENSRIYDIVKSRFNVRSRSSRTFPTISPPTAADWPPGVAIICSSRDGSDAELLAEDISDPEGVLIELFKYSRANIETRLRKDGTHDNPIPLAIIFDTANTGDFKTFVRFYIQQSASEDDFKKAIMNHSVIKQIVLSDINKLDADLANDSRADDSTTYMVGPGGYWEVYEFPGSETAFNR